MAAMPRGGDSEGRTATATRLDSESRRWIEDQSSFEGLTAGRVEAFSDAVFAIAITLLVLELGPGSGQGSLSHRLGEQWPLYVAYLLSFLFSSPPLSSAHCGFGRHAVGG